MIRKPKGLHPEQQLFQAVDKAMQQSTEHYAIASQLLTTILGAEIMSDQIPMIQLLLAIAKAQSEPTRENLNEVVCSALAVHKVGV